MSGVRQFREADVLAKAIEAFRERGYAGVSMTDLEGVTGIKRSSIYNAFGSKAGLFGEVLKAYGRSTQDLLLAQLERDDVFEAFEAMFALQIDRQAAQVRPLGCLATNACVEVGNHGSEVDTHVRDLLEAFEVAVRARLERAVDAGQLDADHDVAGTARFLTAASRSIPLIHRTTGDADYVHAVAEGTMSMLRAARR